MNTLEKKSLKSFWDDEQTSSQITHLIDQGLILDLALRIETEGSITHLNDAFIRFVESKKWDSITQLMQYLQKLGFPGTKTLHKALLIVVKKIPEKLQHCIAQKDSDFEDILPIYHILAHLIDNSPTDAELNEIFDRCHQVLNQASLSVSKKESTLSKKMTARVLTIVGALTPTGSIADATWKKLLNPKQDILLPGSILEKYQQKIPLERYQKIATDFLVSEKMPTTVIQRKNLFRYLYGQGFVLGKLDSSLDSVFQTSHKNALEEQKNIHLGWLSSGTDFPMKVKILHRLQCLLAPSPLIDFCSAYLETKYADKFPQEGSDHALSHLTQAGLQLPSYSDLRREDAVNYPRRQKLVKSLSAQISREKVKIYFQEKRYTSTLPYVSLAIRDGETWAVNLLNKKSAELKLGIDKMGSDEKLLFYISTHHLPKVSDETKKLSLPSSEHYLAKAVEMAQGEIEENRHIHEIVGVLYRAYSLGAPYDEVTSIMNRIKKVIEEKNETDAQALTIEVGDIIGEAMAQTSVSASGGSGVSTQLNRLYDVFKDVLLQQNPYEKETRESLNKIIQEAKALVLEANSIHNESQESTLESIMNNHQNPLRFKMVEDFDSILKAYQCRYVDNENFLVQKLKNGDIKRHIPESLLMRNFTSITSDIVTREISKENNPLLLQLGPHLEDLLDFGVIPENWLLDSKAQFENSIELLQKKNPIIINDRFVISHLVDWIRFENSEALKIPFRKGMSVVCSHLAEAVASSRRTADQMFAQLLQKLHFHPNAASLGKILSSLRKTTSQVNSLQILKKSGILPKGFDRSTEPRARNFAEELMRQLISFGPEVTSIIKADLPKVYTLDKNEFSLGILLQGKEKSLKKYLTLNLGDLTNKYLKPSYKNSLPVKIEDVCIRVQQGLAGRVGDIRSNRYSPILTDPVDEIHTPEKIEALLNSFEENFPIIDRMTGSRETIDSNTLVYVPEEDGTDKVKVSSYIDRVDCYLNNAIKLARQLRIIIIPGEGEAVFEYNSFAICIPLKPKPGRSREFALLSGLADYLYYVKFANEDPEQEDLLLRLINKTLKGTLRAGSTDAKIKITEFIFREICRLCGVHGSPVNSTSISSHLIQAIIGSDNTMIYRELRNISAPQKFERYQYLKGKYKALRSPPKVEEQILDIVLDMNQSKSRLKKEELSLVREFSKMSESNSFYLKEELYDLAVLLYHFSKINESYQVFNIVLRLDPRFAEAYWGLGTVCRSHEMNALPAGEKQAQGIRAYKQFCQEKNVGVFWKKRAQDLIKKNIG